MTETDPKQSGKSTGVPFPDLPALAEHLRDELQRKKFILLYAYNGTGKTRLSTAFKNLGKKVDENGEVTARDTLYFNAFTEDLFQWDNDLANDRERVLKINKASRFFDGLDGQEAEKGIRQLLSRYADFDFYIDTNEWEVSFSRDVESNGTMVTVEDRKISGSECVYVFYGEPPLVRHYNIVRYKLLCEAPAFREQ